MLTQLSIRDIVLIERLDLVLDDGLTVLTGETGAGKSILLDAVGLALGGRGDSSLVRAGMAKGTVTAAFALAPDHPVFALLDEQGLAIEGEVVLRRVQSRDGTSRGFINDQPASIALMRQVGSHLVEIHGQHDNRALIEVANHRRLLDAYGGLEALADEVQQRFAALKATETAVLHHRELVQRVEAERAFIAFSLDELRALAPHQGEEDELQTRRQVMLNAEHFAEAIAEARSAIEADGSFATKLNQALRKLERRREQAGGLLDEACAALERLATELVESARALDLAGRSFTADRQALEETEERLFELRRVARKHQVKVDDLGKVLARFEAQERAIEDGGRHMAELERNLAQAHAAYDNAARRLSEARHTQARRLDMALAQELGPLRLERARLRTEIESDPERRSASGIDRIEFLVSVNPGTPESPLAKVASGGELSRFMLALKVTLASRGSAPTLIFDEIDTGVGGAVADAIGLRLSRLSESLQVLAVTHSPQVASRALRHFLIVKKEESEISEEPSLRHVTRLVELNGQGRREEIARMLSGARITDEARAQAERLLAAE